MMRSRPLVCSVVSIFLLSFATAQARAQSTYWLRYMAGSPAAALVDSIGFRQNPARASSRREQLTVGSNARVYELSTGLATERLVAIDGDIDPAEFSSVEGVLGLRIGSRVEPRSGTPDDPSFPEQWHFGRIEALGAWNYTTGGRTRSGHQIVIGVIEANGFQLDHPDLVDQYYRNPDEVPGNGIDDDGNGFVDDVTGLNLTDPASNSFRRNSHGVHVSGILAARSNDGSQAAGLNWRAKLIPIQVSNTTEWAVGLDYLTRLRRRFNESDGREGAFVVVANCSLGTEADCLSPDDVELNAAIDRAGAVGILVVGATGNTVGDVDRNVDLPSSCTSEFLITVTASTREDSLLAASGFSPTQVDLAAPGEAFRSLDYESGGRVDNTFQQTSGATPQVAGVVALMYAAACETLERQALSNPAAIATLFKSTILDAVDQTDGLGQAVVSGGRLNARRALESIVTSPACHQEAYVVQFGSSASAPSSLLVGEVELRLSDTLSRALRLYRYRARVGGAVTLEGIRALTGITAAVQDRQLIGTGRDFGFGEPTDYLDEIGQPGAIALRRSLGGAGPQAVLAYFDLSFGESPIPASENLLNPFAPGIGVHGEALVGVAQQVADQPTDANGLQLVGYRFGDWLQGAQRVYDTRQAFNQTGGASGEPTVAYVSALRVLGSLDGDSDALAIFTQATRQLREVGCATVLPHESDAVSFDTTSAAALGLLFGGSSDSEIPDITDAGLSAPTLMIPYNVDEPACLVSGDLAAVAQIAGGLVLLHTIACTSDLAGAPSEAFDKRRRVLFESALPTDALPQLDLASATRLLALACDADDGTARLEVYPNPSFAGQTTRVLFGGVGEGALSVFDATGRLMVNVPVLALDPGLETLDLGRLARGTYVVRVAGSAGAESVLLAVQ